MRADSDAGELNRARRSCGARELQADPTAAAGNQKKARWYGWAGEGWRISMGVLRISAMLHRQMVVPCSLSRSSADMNSSKDCTGVGGWGSADLRSLNCLASSAMMWVQGRELPRALMKAPTSLRSSLAMVRADAVGACRTMRMALAPASVMTAARNMQFPSPGTWKRLAPATHIGPSGRRLSSGGGVAWGPVCPSTRWLTLQ